MGTSTQIGSFIPENGEILVLDTNILIYIFRDDIFPEPEHHQPLQHKFKPFTKIIELADQYDAIIHVPKIVLSEFYNRMFDEAYRDYLSNNSWTPKELNRKNYRKSDDFAIRFNATFTEVLMFMSQFAKVEKNQVEHFEPIDFMEEFQILDFVDCELLNYCIKYGFTLVTADGDFKKYKRQKKLKIVSTY
ncbi:MAG: PIN domain-containing protein [Culicoidibacterales bacterium]